MFFETTRRTSLSLRRSCPSRLRPALALMGVTSLACIAGACATSDGESTATSPIETTSNIASTLQPTPTASSEPVGTIEVLSGPDSTTIERFASFAISDGAAECRLDQGTFEPCTSPIFLADVGNGVHTFDVRPAGSTEEAAASTHQWEVLDLWENPTEDLIAATKEPDPAAPNS